MSETKTARTATCPMCGIDNQFSVPELKPVETDEKSLDAGELARGQCRGCGEPIDVPFPADGAKARRPEALIAFLVLAAMGVVFLIALLAMHRP